jgi:GWxTD domain-containing protein
MTHVIALIRRTRERGQDVIRASAFTTLLLLGLAAVAAAATPSTKSSEAEGLYQKALMWLSEPTIETRRQAVSALEQATILQPDNTTYELALARAYYAGGFLSKARQHLEHVTEVEPYDSAHHLELGMLWRNDWLRYLDQRSLERATREFIHATVLDTSNTDAWLLLGPLLLVQDRVGLAMVAAFRAAKSDPARIEAGLAVAAICNRVGLVHEADSLFRASIPHLRPKVRARFEDIAPLASDQETARLAALEGEARAAYVESFWKQRDSDPATPENETRIEYWSRVTQALFLFYDEKRQNWDERGVAWVRWGPPAEMKYDPVGERLSWSFAAGPEFPTAVQVWTYPDQGTKVTLQDRSLSQDYGPGVTRTQIMGYDDRLLPEELETQRGVLPVPGQFLTPSSDPTTQTKQRNP